MIKEDDVVVCTVKEIQGTTIFVEIEGNGAATIVMSEVAAGRIRNLREYVFPNKKIVCKVLKIDPDGHAHLSLRRVTGKEREEIEEQYKKEKTFVTLLKATLKEPEKVIADIKEKYTLGEFLDEIKVNSKLLEKFMKKEEAERLAVLLVEKEEREKTIKKIFILKTTAETGIDDIRQILAVSGVKIRYLGSSQFSLAATAKDFKEADHKVNIALEYIEKQAKEKKAHFELKEIKK